MGSRGNDRRRYIVFRVTEGRAGRRQIVDALARLDAALEESRVLDLTPTHGVLQVPHRLATEARYALEKVTDAGGRPWRAEPLGTSGTVKRARARFMPRAGRGR